MPVYEEMHGVRTDDKQHPETPVSDDNGRSSRWLRCRAGQSPSGRA
jgi:hypothetical protein